MCSAALAIVNIGEKKNINQSKENLEIGKCNISLFITDNRFIDQ
jgi:hypothetical protein